MYINSHKLGTHSSPIQRVKWEHKEYAEINRQQASATLQRKPSFITIRAIKNAKLKGFKAALKPELYTCRRH